MIARRLRNKYARGEPITIENFVIVTISNNKSFIGIHPPKKVKICYVLKLQFNCQNIRPIFLFKQVTINLNLPLIASLKYICTAND